MRVKKLAARLRELLEELSGIEMEAADPTATFLELGLDSLFLTQFALTLHQKFGVKIAFRQLLEDHSSIETLAEHLDRKLAPEPGSSAAENGLPKETEPGPKTETAASVAVTEATPGSAPLLPPGSSPGTVQAVQALQALVEQQLRVMALQLELLSGRRIAPVLATAPVIATTPALARPQSAVPPAQSLGTSATAQEPKSLAGEDEALTAPKYDPKKAFGAIARIHATHHQPMSPRQQARLGSLVRRYTARTAKSKAFTQANRARLADPRVVSGFRPVVKELVYPVVVERSAGSRFWDLDGNEYIDVLCGFGSNFFGNQPRFITDALKAQIDQGFEVGPQHPLAAQAAELMCELTGHDRAAFCNTGSEAVMGCMRVARTVTGRRLIAIFSGSYHGIFDEVIVRGTKKLRSIPAAPGIMPSTVENVLVLDYGTPESLEIIRARATELAAVMVEPVQSRRPDFQPREFLHQLRTITATSGSALIFDEVITGFRIHQGGAQAFFGVQADLASYGKVIGGGLPIGVIAGKRDWMDALDGGHWQFGDASAPTVGVTYFAGTFVRHPLALAACKASLEFLKAQGPALQETLNARTSAFVAAMNAWFVQVGAPLELRGFGSLWKTFFTSEQPLGELLFVLMRDRGLHILDGFPCFFTIAHSEADVAAVAKAYRESVVEAQESGFLPEGRSTPQAFDGSAPPVPGARLGRDPSGNPAWYVPSPSSPGQFVKLER